LSSSQDSYWTQVFQVMEHVITIKTRPRVRRACSRSSYPSEIFLKTLSFRITDYIQKLNEKSAERNLDTILVFSHIMHVMKAIERHQHGHRVGKYNWKRDLFKNKCQHILVRVALRNTALNSFTTSFTRIWYILRKFSWQRKPNRDKGALKGSAKLFRRLLDFCVDL